MTIQLQVYKARPQDQPRVMHLLQSARRSFAAFGLEDLPLLLANGNCMVAERVDEAAKPDEQRLWAFLCVSINRSGWAYLRGAAITDGWRTDDGLDAVLEPLIRRLGERGVSHLAAYGTSLWLVPPLMRAGFKRLDWIISLERHPRPLKVAPISRAGSRPVGPWDLEALTALDESIFEAPYQLASGELIELMVTSGHFVLAELDGQLAGYACADVLGEAGQIIRLAVHPEARRQGIGRMLLNDALVYIQANQARYAVINTQGSNAASLKLYEDFGFRRVGRRVPLLVRVVAVHDENTKNQEQ